MAAFNAKGKHRKLSEPWKTIFFSAGTEDTESKADNRTTTENTDEPELPEPLKPGMQQECQKCCRAFKRTYNLLRHNRLCHGKDGYRFTCSICGKKLSRISHLLEHERTHTNEKPFQCDFCDMRFGKKTAMLGHVARVHPQAAEPNTDKLLKCPVCDKIFQQRTYFNNHKRIHTGERPYLCELCGKTFRSNKAIKTHMINMHDKGIKEHKCSMCVKVFKWKNKLVVHERTHTQERPYACSLCDKRFNQRVLLRMHTKKYHDADDVLNQW